MGRILLTGMALAIGVHLSVTPARADAFDDLDACSTSAHNADWNEVQFYCTRAIDSGQLRSPALSLAFALRCRADNGLQQPALAIEHCSRAIEIRPGDKSAYLNLGFAYLAREEPALAIAAFDSLLARYPESLEGYYNRGLAYRAKGEYARAIEDFDRALAIDPNDASVYHTRGNTYSDMGEYGRAIQDYDQAIRLDPATSYSYTNRAVAYFKTGETERALADCNTALLIDANDADTYSTRADIRFAMGEYDLAIQDYDQSLLIDPAPSHRYEYRGQAHFILGHFGAASGDFAVLVERQPTNGYFALLRSVTGARGGENVVQTFKTDAARVDLDVWPGPIVKYFLGNLGKEGLHAAAEAVEQPGSTERICEYDLYVGEGAMLFNDLGTARAMFQQAELDCPADSIADRLAKAELARMMQ